MARYRENGQEHPSGAQTPARTVPRGTNRPGGLNTEDAATGMNSANVQQIAPSYQEGNKMRNTNKVWRWLTPLFAVALMAAACGDDDSEPEPAAETPTTEAPAAGGEEIEVMASWGDAEQAGFLEVLDAFTEATGIPVSYTSERDLPTVLPTRIAGGNPPDVALIPRPGIVQQFVDDGVAISFADLGVDMSVVNANYAQGVLDLGTFDGELYGLLTASNSKSTVWYKPASLEALGHDTPDTFDELLGIVTAYVDNGQVPLSVGGMDGWTLTDWFENLYVRVAGPEMYNQLFVTHEVSWTDPTVVEAMERFRDLIAPTDERLVGGAAGANSTGFIDAWDLVLAGDAELYYEGGFMGNFARDNFPDLVSGTDYSFFEFPEIDPQWGKPVVGGGDFAVGLVNSPEVRAFLEFIATPEANEIWATVEAGARITPNQGVSADLFGDELTKLEAAQIKAASIFVFDGSDLAPGAVGGDAMFTALQDFIADPDDIDGPLEFIETAADGAY